ncbi:MAG: coproporphyrinogen III oxidase, partial [Casimicrobiaceae bacterium]
GKVDWAQIEARHGRDPRLVLASEISSLAALAAIGVVSTDDRGFQVTPQGRLLLRAVAMAFDAYRNLPREVPITYSRIA